MCVEDVGDFSAREGGELIRDRGEAPRFAVTVDEEYPWAATGSSSESSRDVEFIGEAVSSRPARTLNHDLNSRAGIRAKRESRARSGEGCGATEGAAEKLGTAGALGEVPVKVPIDMIE